MASRYWVGGTGNWSDDTNHWATSSGGAPGAGNKPTASDDANFDALSGAGTVTKDAASVCLNFVEDALSTITTFGGTGSLTISGNFTLGLLSTWSGSGSLIFNATTTGKTITTSGTNLSSPGSISFSGAGGGWTFQDNFNAGNNIINLTKGTLDTNGKTVTCGQIRATGTLTRTLTLGASAINISGLSVGSPEGGWEITTSTNLTFNANTSTITLSDSLSKGFNGGGLTYNNVTASGAVSHFITGANTFANLTRTGTATTTCSLNVYANQIITGTLTLTGNSAVNRLLVNSDTIGTTRTLTAAAVSLTNVDFQDITGAGAASPFTGTSLGDALGNSGITFTTPVTRYWVGNGGNWSDTAHWSTSTGGGSGASVPLCHDTVNIDANSITSASQTITANIRRLGAGINFTGVLNTPALNITISVRASIFGALTLVSGMTSTSGTSILTFEGRSSLTFVTGGITINCPVGITMFGGTLTLSGNLVLSSSDNLALNNGTLDANGNSVTVGLFDSSNSNLRTLTMGSGTWTINGTGTVWTLATSTNLTFNANTSTIVVSDTSATAKTFAGGGQVYYIVTFSGDKITISGNNTFNTLNVNNAGLTNGLKITSGSTQSITSFATNGSVGNLAKLLSTTGGSAATLRNLNGRVSVDYMSITDSTAIGGISQLAALGAGGQGAAWYAGANSTNGGGNTGWIFAAP